MAPITTIVHFEVPADNIDRFLALWQETINGEMTKQPGLIEGIFHRGIDPDGPYQFINVARWQSPEALEAGLRATAEALQRGGIEVAGSLRNLGVKVSQNNYVEEVRYKATVG